MVNNSIKQRMFALGFFELGKGRFYCKNELGKDSAEGRMNSSSSRGEVRTAGLSVVNGFKFTFVALGKRRTFLQIDTCHRILRMENFYETLVNYRGTEAQKMELYRGATLLARYGNHKTYVIESINFGMTPLSTFPIKLNGKEGTMTFKAYVQQYYGVALKVDKQPMILAIAKVEKKINKGKKFTKTAQAIYLVPELVVLTGMSDRQREDKLSMQELGAITKTDPVERKNRIEEMASLINDGSISISSMARMEGYKLQVPRIEAREVQPVDRLGNFDFKAFIKEEKAFLKGEWAFVFSSRVGNPDGMLCYQNLVESAKTYGITIEEPLIVRINAAEDYAAAFVKKKTDYEENYKKKLQFVLVVLSFPEAESKTYNQLKALCTLNLMVKTQFARVETFKDKGIAAAGKVALQMAAKEGSKLWIVSRSHKYWEGRRIAMASISYSKTMFNKFTVALVGTTTNDQTQVHSYAMTGLARKDQISAQIYRQFFMGWLSSYADKEGALPDAIVVYREGLADEQIKRTLSEEIDNLHLTLAAIRESSAKHSQYSPEIAVFTVNKRVNSKFYDFNPKNPKQFGNPTSGSVIFCEMASGDMVDFYLVPHKVEEKQGSALPTQFKLAYFKPSAAREEAPRE